MLTASETARKDGWSEAQGKLAALSTDHEERVVQTSHMGLLEDAQDAATSADAILQVVNAARTGVPLDAS